MLQSKSLAPKSEKEGPKSQLSDLSNRKKQCRPVGFAKLARLRCDTVFNFASNEETPRESDLLRSLTANQRAGHI